MAWPTNKPNSNAFASDTNSIKESRPELNTMSQAVNDIVDFIDTSNIQNNYILKYNSTSGAMEFVAESGGGDTNIQGGAGITVSKDDSAGQHEIAFSGSYSTGYTTYNFNPNDLSITSSGTQPVIQSGSATYTGLILRTNTTSGYTGQIALVGGANGNIEIQPHGSGDIKLEADTTYLGDLNATAKLTTNGTGSLRLSTNNETTSGLIEITYGANQNIALTPDGTGKVRLHGAYNMPTSDGTTGQVIQTDGAGNLSFATLSGGGSISPLTANLETDGYSIIGNNGELNLFIDGNDSGGAPGVKLGTSNTHVLVNQGGISHIGTNGPQLTITPHDTINYSQIFMAGSNSVTADNKILVQATGALEINRLNFPYNLASSASVGQVLRVASINNAGIFNNNDVVNLEFATISSSGGADTQIEAASGGNITVTQPDSGGAFTVGIANPLNNPIYANNNAINDPVLRGYSEHIYNSLGTSGTLTPAVSDGNVQTITLSGNITINSLSSVGNGDSVTLIIRQPASGGPYTLSSSMKFAGGTKTLSTTANAIDVLSIFYDGTDYLASLSTNFS